LVKLWIRGRLRERIFEPRFRYVERGADNGRGGVQREPREANARLPVGIGMGRRLFQRRKRSDCTHAIASDYRNEHDVVHVRIRGRTAGDIWDVDLISDTWEVDAGDVECRGDSWHRAR